MELPSELRDSVTPKMLRSFALMVTSCVLLRTSAPFPRQVLWAWAASWIVARPLVEQSLTGRRSISTTFEPPTLNFRKLRLVESQWAFARCSTHRYSGKVLPSVLFIFADEKSARFPTGTSSCLKPSLTKQ